MASCAVGMLRGFRRVNPAASLKLALSPRGAVRMQPGFRRVNPAASLKQLPWLAATAG